jgi:hypothetical protein
MRLPAHACAMSGAVPAARASVCVCLSVRLCVLQSHKSCERFCINLATGT